MYYHWMYEIAMYTETEPNVFHSGALDQEHWDRIREVAKERNKPVVIFNMDRKQDQQGYWLMGCPIMWFNVPDEFDKTYSVACSEFYKAVGKTAVAFYDAGYIIWFHCLAGVNRSTTANAAFRMLKHGETREQAYAAIKAVRPYVDILPENWKALA